MLVVAEAMSESKNWNFLAQYSILKEMLADLRTIAITWQEKDATEHMEEKMETVEHVGENEKAADDIDQGEGLATVLSEMEREVKDEGNKAGAGEEEPGWIRTFRDFLASLWWRWGEEEETNVATNPSVEKEVPTLGVGAHQEVLQPEEVDDEQLEQFEKELQQLEERMEEHEHDADAHQDGKVQENHVALEEQVGNKCFHLVLQLKTLVGGADEHRAG